MRVSTCDLPLLSVILLELDTIGIAILEFEGQTPGPIHVHGVAFGIEALQAVKVVAWQVDVFDPRGFVDHREANQDSPVPYAYRSWIYRMTTALQAPCS